MPSIYSSLAYIALLSFAQAQYTIKDHFQGSTFFDGFSFFTDGDPTHGFVKYVDQGTAQTNGLIGTTANTAYMGVDYTSKLDPGGSQGGRQSVRLSSKSTYTEGLFIGDFAHIPGPICGVWPAFWTVGGNWPNNGEIDILEGVNNQPNNLISLHTSAGCTISGSSQSGTLVTNDCNQYSPSQSGSGCGSKDTRASSYSTFNSAGGGVYAMEWTSASIKVWFFPRGSIPKDIEAGNPQPQGWSEPVANYAGSCDVASHFKEHNIVFDTTFCGDFAGATFGTDPTCAAKGSCQAYVAGSPGDFKDAYWEVNYVSVYQSTTPAAKANVHDFLAEPPVESALPLVQHQASAIHEVAHAAAGAVGQAPVEGVDPPRYDVAPGMVRQKIATETGSGNGTET